MTRTVEILFRIIRNDADYTQIYPIQGSAPSLIMDGGKDICMSLRGNFVDPGPEVNFLTDRIRPILVIDGTEYPLGLFLPASVQTVVTETGHYLSLEAYDQCWLLRTNMIEDVLSYTLSKTYMSAVKDLLDAAGIGLRLMSNTVVNMGRARSDWNPGTNYLQIINGLLDEINFRHIWFDQEGVAIVMPKADPSTGNIRHVLTENDVRSLLIRGMSTYSDFYSAPNVFVFFSSNAGTAPLTYTATNNDLSSPLSVPRRGRKIYSVTHVDSAPNLATLQALAEKALNESKLQVESITVKTGLLPEFRLDDLVALEINGESSVCIECGWTMELKPGGTMTHKLERTVAING